MQGEGPPSLLNRDAVPNLRLLGLLNVRYLAAEFPMTVDGLERLGRFGSTYLYENTSVLPRAFVVGQVEPVADFDAALDWVQVQSADNLAWVAAVEAGDPPSSLLRAAGASADRPPSGRTGADIEWVRRSPDHLVLNVTLDHPGLLVLSQVWYPGWQGRVDGKPATVLRVDSVLSGLYLEPGRREVSIAYRPLLTRVGGYISGISWAAICLSIIGWVWLRKRHG
jgi:hypothetical protein